MPLSHRSLRRNQSILEQTYQTLRTAILSGQLPAGKRLIETQLANDLQISRTPVREALRLLQHDNLATLDPQGGVRVATISATAAAELYDCRMALEELSIRGACQNATHVHLQDLESLLRQVDKLLVIQDPSTIDPTLPRERTLPLTQYRLLDLDYQFHRLLAQSSGNAWLVALLEQIFDKMLLLRIQTIQHNPDVLEVRLEHHQIYDAIVQRSVEAGVQAIRNHLTASKARVIREVEHMQADRDVLP